MYTRNIHSIAVAHLEGTVDRLVRHVVNKTDAIKSVLTVARRVGAQGVADLNSNLVPANEYIPLQRVFIGRVVRTKSS